MAVPIRSLRPPLISETVHFAILDRVPGADSSASFTLLCVSSIFSGTGFTGSRIGSWSTPSSTDLGGTSSRVRYEGENRHNWLTGKISDKSEY